MIQNSASKSQVKVTRARNSSFSRANLPISERKTKTPRLNQSVTSLSKQKSPLLPKPPERHIESIERDESTVEVDMNHFSQLRNHIFKFSEQIFQIGQNNYSSIIVETNIVQETNRLLKIFKKFFTEATKYNIELKTLQTKLKDMPNYVVPISDLRQASYSFMQKWQETVKLSEIIKENGLESIAKYIKVKVQAVDSIILDLSQKNRRESVHREELLVTGGSLRHNLHIIGSGIQQLLLHTPLYDLKSDLLSSHIANIRAFIQIYCEAHYHKFPKGGFNSVDLSQFKTSVLACCNDMIKALRIAFDMNSQLKLLFNEVDEIEKYLKLITSKLEIPQTITRIAFKVDKEENKEEEDKLEKIKNFVAGPEVSIVVSAKLEEFIEDIQLKLNLPLDDPELNVWERLSHLRENLFDKIWSVNKLENDIKLYQDQLKTQGAEMTEMMTNFHKQLDESSIIQTNLHRQIRLLEANINKLEEEKDEALTTIRENEIKMKKIKDEVANIRNTETMKKAEQRMCEMLGPTHPGFGDGTTNVDQMNVFIMQKRCSKCREYEEQLRISRETMRRLGFNTHGSLSDAVAKMGHEVETLRQTNQDLGCFSIPMIFPPVV